MALLITDKAAADVRPTYDVGGIAEITSYSWIAKLPNHSFGFHKKSTDSPAKANAFETADPLGDAQKKIERFRARQRSL